MFQRLQLYRLQNTIIISRNLGFESPEKPLEKFDISNCIIHKMIFFLLLVIRLRCYYSLESRLTMFYYMLNLIVNILQYSNVISETSVPRRMGAFSFTAKTFYFVEGHMRPSIFCMKTKKSNVSEKIQL